MHQLLKKMFARKKYPSDQRRMGLSRSERNKLARLLKEVRANDRKYKNTRSIEYRTNRSIKEVSDLLGYNLIGLLKEMIETRRERTYRVLDIGCGEGTALAGLKEGTGPQKKRVVTYGLTATKLKKEQKGKIDNVFIGAVETKQLPRQTFALVYSAQAIYADQLPKKVLEKIVHSLVHGGIFISHINANSGLRETLDGMKKQGKIDYEIKKGFNALSETVAIIKTRNN
ncbi:MAG: class I SAM-dependent methyltransferase [archaeon]